MPPLTTPLGERLHVHEMDTALRNKALTPEHTPERALIHLAELRCEGQDGRRPHSGESRQYQEKAEGVLQAPPDPPGPPTPGPRSSAILAQA